MDRFPRIDHSFPSSPAPSRAPTPPPARESTTPSAVHDTLAAAAPSARSAQPPAGLPRRAADGPTPRASTVGAAPDLPETLEVFPSPAAPHARPHALTLESLDAWVSAPGQSPEEHAQRRELAALLTCQPPRGSRRLRVPHNLQFERREALTSLPPGLHIAGRLELFGCTSLTTLPEGLSVGRKLDLFNCRALTTLPRGLQVGGDLDLTRCEALVALPSGLHVGGGLNIQGAPLTALPPDLRVGGSLNARYCRLLRSVPASIQVGGDLVLSGCSALTTLPAGLQVNRSLDLADSTAFTHLPPGLHVRGRLSLRDCTALAAVPPDLRVEEGLDLSGCRALASLPEELLRLPPSPSGRRIQIDITGTNISPADIAALLRAEGDGMHLEHGRDPAILMSHVMAEAFADLPTARTFWLALVPEPDDTHENGHAPAARSLEATPEQTGRLLEFLGRLRETADYKNLHSRPLLAARVVNLMHHLDTSPEIAAMCHDRIGEALESCGDRVIWTMNQMELTLRVHAAQTGAAPQQALHDLGSALVRLEEVHRHAAAKVAALTRKDPIEVYLAYETALAAPLALPVSTQGMLFLQYSNVTARDIAAAETAGRAAGQDGPRVASFLESWAPWQTHQRREAAKHCSWEQLPLASAPVPEDAQCMFTLETLAELRAGGLQPTVIAGDASASVFAFAPLITWWKEHGTHPLNRSPLRLEDLRSLAP